MDNIKKQIHETVMEFDKRGMKGAADVDHIYKLLLSLWLMKDLGMDMEDEYSREGRYSGRRDSMGRYARDGGGGSYDSYDSYEGGGYSSRRGYSRTDPKEEIMEALEKAKHGMKGEEKEIIHRMMQMAKDL